MVGNVGEREGFEPVKREEGGQSEPMTPKEIELARHALGLNRGRIVNRNFFICPETHVDWNRMVAAGYAVKGREGPGDGDRVFKVTQAGLRIAMKRGEKVDHDRVRFG